MKSYVIYMSEDFVGDFYMVSALYIRGCLI